MIPLSRIVAEIEKQAANAKLRGDETGIRESLVAIRSLCNVALEESSNHLKQPLRIVEPQSQPIQSSEPLNEDGANGDSLFDF